LKIRPTTMPLASRSKSSSFHWPDGRLGEWRCARLWIRRAFLLLVVRTSSPARLCDSSLGIVFGGASDFLREGVFLLTGSPGAPGAFFYWHPPSRGHATQLTLMEGAGLFLPQYVAEHFHPAWLGFAPPHLLGQGSWVGRHRRTFGRAVSATAHRCSARAGTVH
jgi:hypothetical protein